jgi:hypothetical protein
MFHNGSDDEQRFKVTQVTNNSLLIVLYEMREATIRLGDDGIKPSAMEKAA